MQRVRFTAGGDRERSIQSARFAESLRDVYLSTVTTASSELVNIQSTFSHLCERDAAVEQISATSARPLPVAQDLLPAH